MKYKVFILAFLMMLCFVACGTEDENVTGQVEDNPLNEKEIIEYVKDYMISAFNDEVDVKVLGKYDLSHTTYRSVGLDGAPGLFGNKYAKIKKGHWYKLEITNEKDNITVEGRYSDGYALYYKDTGTTETVGREVYVNTVYSRMKEEIRFNDKAEDLLNKYFTKYHLYKDPTNTDHFGYYNIYVYCTDDKVLNEAFSKLVEMIDAYYLSVVYEFRAFIFTDEKFYDSFDFDICNSIEILDPLEKEKEHPDKMKEVEIEYHPEKIIERYLKHDLKYITSCDDLDHEVFVTKGVSGFISDRERGWYNKDDDTKVEDIDHFDQVIYIYKGDPQMYKNSLHDSKKKERHGMTSVYGIDMDN